MCLHFHFLTFTFLQVVSTSVQPPAPLARYTTLNSSSTVIFIVWKIYILKNNHHQYGIQIIIDIIVLDMQICILKSSSAPPTLLRFLTLIFPSPPHLLLQSGHYHHHHHSDQLLLRSCHQYCHRPQITQVMIIFVGVINVFFNRLFKSFFYLLKGCCCF